MSYSSFTAKDGQKAAAFLRNNSIDSDKHNSLSLYVSPASAIPVPFFMSLSCVVKAAKGDCPGKGMF